MKPAKPLTLVTDRQRFRELELRPSQIVQPGRVMFSKHGGKGAGFAGVAELEVAKIPKGATVMTVAADDFADIREWIG